MEELIGTTNTTYLKQNQLGHHLPESYESLGKYIHHVTISEEKLKSIKFINITFYDKWLDKYLPLMTNLDIAYVSFNGVLDNFQELYRKIFALIPAGIKIIIFRNHIIDYLTNFLANLPITLQKIIILDDIRNYSIMNNNIYKNILIKEKFKYVPFGCKIVYSFGFDNSDKSGKNIELI